MVMKLNKMVFDDKKIEEAARGAADLYEQDLPIMSYDEDTEVDGQHHFCQEFGAELFKDGVKWAINEFLKNLWHPNTEEPKHHSYIMFKTANNGFETEYIDCSWERFVRVFKITQWLYIDDLFPKEGGNHD